MSLPLALGAAALAAVVGNRILALGVGLWFEVPGPWLLSLLILIDLAQIPLFYKVYDHGAAILQRLPERLNRWIRAEGRDSRLRRWASSFGGAGILLVAALPTLGGGMWSAVFLAYGLRLPRARSAWWLALGSVLSYGALFIILDTLFSVARYLFR